jgi:CBS domain-containing protein
MKCPYCGHENVPGADTCEECMQSLTDVEPAAVPRAHNLLYNAVRTLNPAPPLYVVPETTVGEAIRTMVDHRIGCVLVGDSEHSEGVFSERDVLMKVSKDSEANAGRPISEFMTPNPETVALDDEIAFALHKMDVGGYRHLPVTDNDRVVGIISVRDVLKLLVEEASPSS